MIGARHGEGLVLKRINVYVSTSAGCIICTLQNSIVFKVCCHRCKGDYNPDVGIHSLQYASVSPLGERWIQVDSKSESEVAGEFHLDFPQRLHMLLLHCLASCQSLIIIKL